MAGICVDDAAIVEPRSDRNGAEPQATPSIALPNQPSGPLSCRVAIDIGGSLVKLVFFTPTTENGSSAALSGNHTVSSPAGGMLECVKFETARMDEVLSFVESRGLLRHGSGGGSNASAGSSGGGAVGSGGAGGSSQCLPDSSSVRDDHSGSGSARILATGGGAFKFASQFKERLGVSFEKGDEMDCLVRGCNFLLTRVPREAFTFRQGQPSYIDKANGDAFPYLLVNIGSGVSMLKVSSAMHAERVSGSALGGGTFAGLCRLLTGARTFDEMLELAARGDNTKVDMLVGDIYGKGRDYSKIKLSADTIASSFGKVVSGDLNLEDCDPADISLSLCRMVSYNVAQIAYEVATTHGLQRVLFGGFFIRANAFTMETITFALDFWSKGQMAATFLRHEGFLGAIGALFGADDA